MKFVISGEQEGSIRDQIGKAFDNLKSEYVSRVGSYYGEQVVNDDMFNTGRVFVDPEKFRMGGSRLFSNPLYDQIARLYKEEWEKHYKSIQDMHRSSYAGDPLTETHMTRKRETSKGPHNSKPVEKPVAYAVWTGFMRDTISRAFTMGGTQEMKVPHYLIAGGYSIGEREEQAWNRVSDMYFGNPSSGTNFTEHFENKHSDYKKKDLIKFSSHLWGQVADLMVQAAHEGIVHPLVEVFDEFEIRI